MAAVQACLLLLTVRLTGPETDPERVRHQLDEILKRPEFQDVPRNFWAGAFLDALRRFFSMLGQLRSTNPVLYWVLLIGCWVLLALIVGHLVRSIYSVFFVSARAAAQNDRARRHRLSAQHAEEATREAEHENFTEAIRHLFLSLVYWFDESGKVQFQRAYTNREYLDLFAHRQEIHEPLQTLVDTLDENWYGQHPTLRPQYERCRRLFETLKA